jgi:tetratricopeptide (TPR) repeat protein
LQPLDSWGLSQRLASLHVQRVFLHKLGRMDEATESARKSVAALEAAPADLPDRDREMVRATLDLGMFLHEQRQHEEGRAMIEDALERLRTLRAARPDDVPLVVQEAHALFTADLCSGNAERLDDCQRRAGRLVDEVRGFLARQEAASLAGQQRGYLTKMASLGSKRLAHLADLDGRAEDAIRLAQERQRLCRDAMPELLGDARTELETELIDASLSAAGFLAKSGREADAEAALAQAAEMALPLHEGQPGVWEYAWLLALVFQRQAEMAADRGEEDAAVERFRSVIALMEPHMGKAAHRQETEALLAAAREGLRMLGNGDEDQIATSEPQAEGFSGQ